MRISEQNKTTKTVFLSILMNSTPHCIFLCSAISYLRHLKQNMKKTWNGIFNVYGDMQQSAEGVIDSNGLALKDKIIPSSGTKTGDKIIWHQT